MLRVFASFVGSCCSLCWGQIRILLFPHLTPPYRDLGHLHSKGQCPLHTPKETRRCAPQRSTYDQGKRKTEPVAQMSHASRVVTGTCVVSPGSARQVPQVSTTDLEGSCTLAPFEKFISLSKREVGMNPLPSFSSVACPQSLSVWPSRSHEGQAGGRIGFFFYFLLLGVQSSQAPYGAWLTVGSYCCYINSFPASRTSLPRGNEKETGKVTCC